MEMPLSFSQAEHPATEERAFIDKVACIVLAGGQGERLFPLTRTRCKPAVTFGGKYCLIDIPLSHALNAKIPSIFVISQYLAESLHRHILDTYVADVMRDSKIHLLSPEETPTQKVWYQGTADAIRQNRVNFQSSSAEYFLILSGDQLYNMDLQHLLAFAKQSDADLVIAALPVEKPEAMRMGLLTVNGEGGIQNFAEKPEDPEILKNFEIPGSPGHYLGSMGIYVFKRKALFALLGHEGNDFGKHLIPKQLSLGKTVAFTYPGYWEDIGTIRSYYEANMALLKGERCLDIYDEKNPIFAERQHLPSSKVYDSKITGSMIGAGSIVYAKEITQSVVGIKMKIGRGTVLRQSILVGNRQYAPGTYQSPPLPEKFGIGEGCLIENAIIDSDCLIGNYVQLINKQGLSTHDGDGFYVRDGIIIVPAGSTIPDGFVF